MVGAAILPPPKILRENMPNIYFETISETVCKYAKEPSPAINGVADWWKEIPKYKKSKKNVYDIPENIKHSRLATIRNCPGINDTLSFGYMMYFPTDIFVDSTKDEITCFVPNVDVSKIEVTGLPYLSFNEEEATSDFKISEEFHPISLKLNPLWGIKTDRGYSSWITSPVNRLDLPFKVVDAIVDTDVYPSRFPISFHVKKNFCGTIKNGTPFLQIIPFKRENFNSKIIELNNDEVVDQSFARATTFTNFYKKFFWTRKKFS